MVELETVCTKCNEPIDSEQPHTSHHHVLFGNKGKVIIGEYYFIHAECVDLGIFGIATKEMLYDIINSRMDYQKYCDERDYEARKNWLREQEGY